MFRPRFSLRSLAIVVAFLGSALGWHGRCRYQWRDVEMAKQRLIQHRFDVDVQYRYLGSTTYSPPSPWACWVGPEVSEIRLVKVGDVAPEAASDIAKFRNPISLRLQGSGIDDGVLAALVGPNTRCVSLFPFVGISPEGLNVLRRSRVLTTLDIREGQPLAADMLEWLAQHQPLTELNCAVFDGQLAQLNATPFRNVKFISFEVHSSPGYTAKASHFRWMTTLPSLRLLALKHDSAKCLLVPLEGDSPSVEHVQLAEMNLAPGELQFLRQMPSLRGLAFENCRLSPEALSFALQHAPEWYEFTECDLPQIDAAVAFSRRLHQIEIERCSGAWQELELAASQHGIATWKPNKG